MLKGVFLELQPSVACAMPVPRFSGSQHAHISYTVQPTVWQGLLCDHAITSFGVHFPIRKVQSGQLGADIAQKRPAPHSEGA